MELDLFRKTGQKSEVGGNKLHGRDRIIPSVPFQGTPDDGCHLCGEDMQMSGGRSPVQGKCYAQAL